jgi:Methylmalonyl-CoA mutase
MRKNLATIAITDFENYPETNWEHLDFGAGFPPFLRGRETCTLFGKTNFSTQKTIVSKNNCESVFEMLYLILLEGIQYVHNEIEKGELIDTITENLSFAITGFENELDKTAYLRACRMVWAKTVKKFNPKNDQAMALNLAFTSDINYSKYKTSPTVDPWGGSYYIENLTIEIAEQLIEKLKIG